MLGKNIYLKILLIIIYVVHKELLSYVIYINKALLFLFFLLDNIVSVSVF